MKQVKNWILGGLSVMMLAVKAFAEWLTEWFGLIFFVFFVAFFIWGDDFEAYQEAHRIEEEAYQFRKAVETYQSGDYATALAEFTSLVEGRHIESQFYLGVMYDNGWGVPQDDAEAAKWYRRVAEARHSEVGHAEAQFNLGLMYEEGRNVPQDGIFAYVWYYLAADKGHEKASKRRDMMASRMTPVQFTEAQYNLGKLYANGKGVPRDFPEALKWYSRAAEAGDVNLQYRLGQRYERGRGTPQDDAEALKWYRLAAESGHVLAQIKIRKMYERGDGAPQDDAEALKWHRRAAEMGDAESQSALGRKYEKGDGVPQDYLLAYMWYDVAATRGYEWAEDDRNDVARSMSSEEIAEAKRMSRQCLAQNYKNC